MGGEQAHRLDGKTRELFLARGVGWRDAGETFGADVRLKPAGCDTALARTTS